MSFSRFYSNFLGILLYLNVPYAIVNFTVAYTLFFSSSRIYNLSSSIFTRIKHDIVPPLSGMAMGSNGGLFYNYSAKPRINAVTCAKNSFSTYDYSHKIVSA